MNSKIKEKRENINITLTLEFIYAAFIKCALAHCDNKCFNANKIQKNVYIT